MKSRELPKQNKVVAVESCSVMNGATYIAEVYKIPMVRMGGCPDELANVRVYKWCMQKCICAFGQVREVE